MLTPKSSTRRVSTPLVPIMLLMFLLTVPLRAQENPQNPASEKSLATLWSELKTKDRTTAKHALEEFIDRKQTSVDFLSKKITSILQNASPYKPTKNNEMSGPVENLVQKLGHKTYQVRKQATEKLESLCKEHTDARSHLQTLLKQNEYLPEVTHRIESVLSQVSEKRKEEQKLRALQQNGTRLRLCRTIRILGEIGNDRAKTLLQKIIQQTTHLPEQKIAKNWISFTVNRNTSGTIRNNHQSTPDPLNRLLKANQLFRVNDTDGNGINDYWTWDIWGLYAIQTPEGNQAQLITKNMATADYRKGPSSKHKQVSEWPGGPPEPYNGYYFSTFQFEGTGSNRTEFGKRSSYDVAYMAFPASYGRSGQYAFIFLESGHVYRIDAFLGGYNFLFGPPTTAPGTPPKKTCPTNPKKSGYHPIK